MTLRMADSTNAANLPAGMDAYGGYDDGHWPDFQAVAAGHAVAHLVEFTALGGNRGNADDIEPGDDVAAHAPDYVLERTAAGVWRPIVYTSLSNVNAVVGDCAARGVGRGAYRLLVAHYGAGAHICPGADGCQWIDHGAWDESMLVDDFFGAVASAGGPPGHLAGGQLLGAGAAIVAAGWQALMQGDGNLVVIAPGNRPMWSSGTGGHPGSVALMQPDGNLVVIAPGNRPVWSSGTGGHPGSVLAFQDDGNLVVYAPGHTALWSSHT